MRWLICGLTIFLAAPSYPEQWEVQSEEEALFLRRIADFWREGEYQIVKSEITEFLQENPDSSFSQTLHASLGDLYIRENNFKGALMQYAHVDEPEIVSRIFLNRMQCLLELQWFATLADECEAYLSQDSLDQPQRLRASYLLAIALYQQCLNAPEDSETLQKLAHRAVPYFQDLLQSSLSGEIAQASAHLYNILKEYDKAAEIYLNLSEDLGNDRQEMLFQAALFQAQYDKPLAQKTFQKIAESGQSRAADAVYNSMVLSYDCGEYEKLIENRDSLLSQICPEQHSSTHLFFGRSYLQLKKYPEALTELLAYAKEAEPSEIYRAALIDILDAAYRIEDVVTLFSALERFSELYPEDPQLPKAYLSQALLLKKRSQFDQTRSVLETIRSKFPHSDEFQTALFEQLHLEYYEKQWDTCRNLCRDYLGRYPNSDLSPFAWRFLAASSSHLASKNPNPIQKEQLAFDLESLLMQPEILAPKEMCDWTFLLAKTNYDLNCYEEAIATLEKLLESDTDFSQKANAHLLLALSYRDGLGDTIRFCYEAKEALSLGADLLDTASQHIALFNGYLEQENEELHEYAAHHLYLASLTLSVQTDNLLWLADYYYAKSQLEPKSSLYSQRAAEIMEKFLASTGMNPQKLEEGSLVFESALVKLAELYGQTGRSEKQLALLESLKQQQEEHPEWSWLEKNSVELLLAQNYESSDQGEMALGLYDRIAARSPTVRSFASAFATLKSARLRLATWAKNSLVPAQPELGKVLAQLKTLSLQKTLANEPVHLEAALEYIDLQTALESDSLRAEKRLSLLYKTKEDFETQQDLLSKDYHARRKHSADKDRIYRCYLTFFDAEILFCRFTLSNEEKERFHLLENAKRLYEEILRDSPTEYLAERAQRQLEQLEK